MGKLSEAFQGSAKNGNELSDLFNYDDSSALADMGPIPFLISYTPDGMSNSGTDLSEAIAGLGGGGTKLSEQT